MNNSEMIKSQEVDWRQLQGSPYVYPLHPKMLSTDGYVLEKNGHVVGMSKYEPAIPLRVTFKEDYVIQTIKRSILEKLKPENYNALQAIVSKAWKLWKEENS